MATNYIKIVDYIQTTHIEITFIQTLADNGLLTLIVLDNQQYIDEEQLPDLEKFSNWHYELEVNHQGIEVAYHLLKKIEQLQQEVAQLKMKTKLIEDL